MNQPKIKPLPYQEPAIERHSWVFSRYKASLEASGTGFGKTYVALFVAKQMQLPVGIVCPKAVIGQWKKAADEVGIEPVFCTNYEQVKSKKFPHGKWMWRGKEAKTAKKQFQWDLPEQSLLIFDEVHVCKNRKAQNSKLLVGAVNEHYILALSATVAENPMDLYALGMALGLHDGTSQFWWFLRAHGVVKTEFGFKFNGDTKAIERIRNHIYPERGYRINPQEIPGFPENQINLVTVTHKNAKAVEQQLTDLWDKMMDDIPLPVVELLRARQESELLKVDYLADQILNVMQEGYSVAVFLNFKETIRSVYKLVSEKIATGVSVIDGDHNNTREQELFQNNTNHLILVQIQSGGQGIDLHDLHGRPRMSFISPSYNARQLLQVMGRIHRAGQLSKSIQNLLFLQGTTEEKVMKQVQKKVGHISSLNDNDVNPFADATVEISK